MASNKLKSFIAQTGKSSSKIISGLALSILLTLAAQEQANAQTGGVGINENSPEAGIHITSNADRGGLLITAQDTALFPNPVAGVINQHTDGNYYKHNGTNRVSFNGIDGTNGTNGVSITFLGTFPTAPVSPSLNEAYRNSTTGQTLIWNGSSRQLMNEDGADANVVDGTITGETLYWDNTAGEYVPNTNLFNAGANIGIGETTPQYKLQISGVSTTPTTLLNLANLDDSAGAGAYMRFTNRSSNPSDGINSSYIGGERVQPGVPSTLTHDLVFGTGITSQQPTEKMRLKGNGNLGLGTATPLDKFHLNNGRFRMDSTAATGRARMKYMPLTKTYEIRGAPNTSSTETALLKMNVDNKSVAISDGNVAPSKLYVENNNSSFATNGALQVYNSTNNGLVGLFRTDSLDTNAKGVQIQSGNTGLGVIASTGDAVIVDAVTGTNAVRADKGNINAVDGNVIERGKNLVRFHGLLTADPTVDIETGDMYYNSSTSKLRFYTGTGRIDLN